MSRSWFDSSALLQIMLSSSSYLVYNRAVSNNEREIIEGWALWQPDAYRARGWRWLSRYGANGVYTWQYDQPTGRVAPGEAVRATRGALTGLTSDQLANVAPWWVKIVCG